MKDYITAEKLIVLLRKVPPKTMVLVSSDEEGNGYRPLMDTGYPLYYSKEWESISSDKDINFSKRCIVLW